MNSFENTIRPENKKENVTDNTKNTKCHHDVIQKMENYQYILNKIKNDHIPASLRLNSFIIGENDFYSKERLDHLHKKIAELSEIIHDMDETKNEFSGNSNLSHVFGNGAQLLIGLTELKLRKKISLKDIEREFENKTPQEKDLIKNKLWEEIKKNFSEEEIEIFRQNKESWGLVEYYVNYLCQQEHRDTLIEEVGSIDSGYLHKLSKFYTSEKIPAVYGDRLIHFKFFTRIKHKEITSDNFEDEFANLGKYSSSLNKEKILEAIKNNYPF